MKLRCARHRPRCDLGIALLSAVLLAPATVQARTPFDSTGLAVVDGSLLVAQASFDDLFEATDDDTQDEETNADADADATVAGSEDDAASATESTAIQSFDDLFDDTAGGTTAATATAATTGSAFHFNGFVQNELGYTYAGDDPHSRNSDHQALPRRTPEPSCTVADRRPLPVQPGVRLRNVLSQSSRARSGVDG